MHVFSDRCLLCISVSELLQDSPFEQLMHYVPHVCVGKDPKFESIHKDDQSHTHFLRRNKVTQKIQRFIQ